MRRVRGELVRAAESRGLQVAAAGTHPFSTWIDQVISPGERYKNIVEELQQLARSLLIFGMHVHVAVPDRTTMIDLMNMARYFLPHLLALSTSSPFWMGRDTGLKSFRTTVFRRFPRTGMPDHFEFLERVRRLRHAAREACIASITPRKSGGMCARIPPSARWNSASCDVAHARGRSHRHRRAHPGHRREAARLYTRNMGFRIYHRALIEENKWRAARWGVEGKLIDFGKQAEVPMTDAGRRTVGICGRCAGRTRQPRRARTHSRNLPPRHSAERQLRVYRETGDLKAVVRHIVADREDDRRRNQLSSGFTSAACVRRIGT